MLYLAVSACGLAVSLTIPLMVHLIRRRRVVVLGTLAMMAAAVLLLSDNLFVYALGMFFYVAGSIAIDVSLNLYLMDTIPRREFARFEPVRIWFMGVAFIIGPYLGVWLVDQCRLLAAVAPDHRLQPLLAGAVPLPQALRQPGDPGGQNAAAQPDSIFPTVFPPAPAAPCLALGGRAFGLVGDVFHLRADLLRRGGAGRRCRRHDGIGRLGFGPPGARVGKDRPDAMASARLMLAGYAAAPSSAWWSRCSPAHRGWASVLLLFAAVVPHRLIDGAGNMLFLRAVHPYERPEMTSVFATFRDTSQIGPPAVCSPCCSRSSPCRLCLSPAACRHGGHGAITPASCPSAIDGSCVPPFTGMSCFARIRAGPLPRPATPGMLPWVAGRGSGLVVPDEQMTC